MGPSPRIFRNPATRCRRAKLTCRCAAAGSLRTWWICARAKARGSPRTQTSRRNRHPMQPQHRSGRIWNSSCSTTTIGCWHGPPADGPASARRRAPSTRPGPAPPEWQCHRISRSTIPQICGPPRLVAPERPPRDQPHSAGSIAHRWEPVDGTHCNWTLAWDPSPIQARQTADCDCCAAAAMHAHRLGRYPSISFRCDPTNARYHNMLLLQCLSNFLDFKARPSRR